MGKIEEYFKKNREALNNQVLPLNHEKRFLKKLKKEKGSSALKWWYGVAAGFIFLAMLSFFAMNYVYNKRFVADNAKVVCLSDISSNYQEVEEYYQAGVNEKIAEFKHLQCNIDTEQQIQINNELLQFDKNYQNLQIEMQKNMNDERIIQAMVNNYETKIRFLELVIDQIKENC